MLIAQSFYPTLYALSDPYPIAVCKGTLLPDGSQVPEGERTYANACTIKVLFPGYILEGRGADRRIAWVIWRTISDLRRLLWRGF